jgi:hypothetical protein
MDTYGKFPYGYGIWIESLRSWLVTRAVAHVTIVEPRYTGTTTFIPGQIELYLAL